MPSPPPIVGLLLLLALGFFLGLRSKSSMRVPVKNAPAACAAFRCWR